MPVDAYGLREIVKMRLRSTNQVCGSLRTVPKFSNFPKLSGGEDNIYKTNLSFSLYCSLSISGLVEDT